MKKFTFTFLLSIIAGALCAQMVSITYDYELNRFAENEPLPAETSFLINGSAPATVSYIEISLYSAEGKEGRAPLAVSVWKQPYNRTGNDFYVPVNFQLRAGKTYDLRLAYFRALKDSERSQLYEQLSKYAESYLLQSFEVKNEEIRLMNSPRQTHKELNDLLRDALGRYRGTVEPAFRGFSDIIRLKLDQLDKQDIGQSLTTTPDSTTSARRRSSLPAGITELLELIDTEIKFTLNKELAVLVDSRYIDNYEVESRRGYFGLNVGYGAAFFGGDVDDPNYDSEVYVGVGFPLSTSRIAPNLLRNASFGFGVFINNMTDQEDNVISGPVIKRPFYAGLDYKLFSFIRINFGAAFLERLANDNGSNGAVLVRPFVGVSGKINLSLSLAD